MKTTRIFSIAISISAMTACSNSQSDKTTNESAKTNNPVSEIMEEMKRDSAGKPQKNPYENAKIEVKTFVDDNVSGTKEYGYDIYIYGGKVIHQPNIPAVPGNRGFKTDADAKKIGEYVANKIRNNIRPPALSVEELDSLGVLK